ncbi:hypothetical protein [Streptomyces sp. NPDC045714]|uniref:hypothetical protein n=1 Tax=Streptomyces sp. NPDC045714 TaxID=3154913 RepID=UPI0033DE6591
MAAELGNTREDRTADATVEGELAAEWQGRIRRLSIGRPEIAVELRRLLDELAPGRQHPRRPYRNTPLPTGTPGSTRPAGTSTSPNGERIDTGAATTNA